MHRWIRIALTAVICWTVWTASAIGETDMGNGRLRVYLRSLKIEETIKIDVNGSYMIQEIPMLVKDGATLHIIMNDGKMNILYEDAVIAAGPNLTLLQCEGEDEDSYLKINGSGGAYYGDLHLSVDMDRIIPVLEIFIEDYLLGVVPFEMGDAFPVEALKAQAVAARTYAMIKAGTGVKYDLEDTTNDQVYRGRVTGSPLSEQAVRETEGIYGVYNGKLAQCYYSASNGGQTEDGQNVWPSDDIDRYAYMEIKEDPYDLGNEKSVVKRIAVPKHPQHTSEMGNALYRQLAEKIMEDTELSPLLNAWECIRIDEVADVRMCNPKYTGESRVFTDIVFDLRISKRECLNLAELENAAMPAIRQEGEPENGDSLPAVTEGITPKFGDYVPQEGIITVTLDYFAEAERAMGLSINTAQNELISIYDIGEAFIVEARRFGHGVGMSQRGAEEMAGKYGKSYREILAFYYPHMELIEVDVEKKPAYPIEESLLKTPEPTPSPTPRPTLMPVSMSELSETDYLAVVSYIDADSSLNLRKYPSLSADIIIRLYKDQRLVVMDVSPDGWAHVKTDAVEGYVRSEYLQAENDLR